MVIETHTDVRLLCGRDCKDRERSSARGKRKTRSSDRYCRRNGPSDTVVVYDIACVFILTNASPAYVSYGRRVLGPETEAPLDVRAPHELRVAATGRAHVTYVVYSAVLKRTRRVEGYRLCYVRPSR